MIARPVVLPRRPNSVVSPDPRRHYHLHRAGRRRGDWQCSRKGHDNAQNNHAGDGEGLGAEGRAPYKTPGMAHGRCAFAQIFYSYSIGAVYLLLFCLMTGEFGEAWTYFASVSG